MVKSGLVDYPDVSQYRLAAHLGLAVFLFGIMLRYGLRLRRGYDAVRPMLHKGAVAIRQQLVLLSILVFVTILSGGFVAGLNAGLIYNTFPLMDGDLIPGALYDLEPFYLSAFEDIMTVQFNHRVLAMATLLGAIIVWLYSFVIDLTPRQRASIMIVVLAVVLQVALGITTLLMTVPIHMASLHQFGAIVLLSAIIYAIYVVEWNR
jgi:cytochrome c oxidase assembly protein subunit 15